jgi:hypothetical protein
MAADSALPFGRKAVRCKSRTWKSIYHVKPSDKYRPYSGREGDCCECTHPIAAERDETLPLDEARATIRAAQTNFCRSHPIASVRGEDRCCWRLGYDDGRGRQFSDRRQNLAPMPDKRDAQAPLNLPPSAPAESRPLLFHIGMVVYT